jgi:hypothetical protein
MFTQLLLNAVFTFAGVYLYNIYNQVKKQPLKTMRFSYFETPKSLNEKEIDHTKMCDHLNIYDMLPENYKNKSYFLTVYLDEKELKLCYIVNTYFDTDYIHDLTESDHFKVNGSGDILYNGVEADSVEYWRSDNLYSICLKEI